MASKRPVVDNAGNEDERPNKRPRLGQGGTVDNAFDTAASLAGINADCLLHILTFLPSEDLNSIAICGRRYEKARAHESLDQTRTGTIVISQVRTIDSFFNLIATNSWGESFHGNRIHLKIMGLERLRRGQVSRQDLIQQGEACRFTGVATLELAGDLSVRREACDFRGLCYAFHNLVDLEMSSLAGEFEASFLCHCFCENCPYLRRLMWNGCEGDGPFNLNGYGFSRARNLTGVVMDDSHFACDEMWDRERNDSYMFQHCRSLQRLSIKNATYHDFDDEEYLRRPVSQDMLIKMVRLHPTLRWLRSDLTEENVAMLQRERPGVTLVRN